ncbi:MAG: hypothetical protein IT236_09895 [Bacteroidia bacterium]|nr:hypothetical protein [Bacteroidia bacterium]
MTKSILKTVVFGALVGAALFFAPKFIIGLCIFFGIMRLFMFGRMRHHAMYQYVMADKVRNMSDEEFARFKNNMFGAQGHCNHNYDRGHCHHGPYEKMENKENKTSTENKETTN